MEHLNEMSFARNDAFKARLPEHSLSDVSLKGWHRFSHSQVRTKSRDNSSSTLKACVVDGVMVQGEAFAIPL